MANSKAFITIHNVLHLVMDLRGLTPNQQRYKIGLFCKINHNLKLRKIKKYMDDHTTNEVWMMRTGGRWVPHTKIVLS